MTRFAITVIFGLLLASPAAAFTANSGFFTGQSYVADTGIAAPDGRELALCHQTRDLRLFGLTLYSQIEGYVLARDGCDGAAERSFSAQQMETAQALNLVDTDLPVDPSTVGLPDVFNATYFWIALGLLIAIVVLRRVMAIVGYMFGGPMRKKARQRIITAMCYMAKCDGIVASNEVALIADAASRITHQKIEPSEIMRIADHIDMNLAPQDYVGFGKGLRDSEKDAMMRAAFIVAFASGRIISSEYHFLTSLADGIGMPGQHFRGIMDQALNDLDKGLSTL